MRTCGTTASPLSADLVLCHGWRGPRNISRPPRMHDAATLGELLPHAAREAPDADAFRSRGERLSYRDWDTFADRLAGGLWARGVRPGDVVALLLPSTPLYLVAYLAAARMGAVTTGINVRYRRTEIAHVLARAGARLLVGVARWHDAGFRGVVQPRP